MHRVIRSFLVLSLAIAPIAMAQQPTGPGFQPLPLLPLRPITGNFHLPANYVEGEVSAVQVNEKGHVFILQRSTPSLSEFDEHGNFIRIIGEGLFNVPHGLRIDSAGNFWVTDTGNHLVLKLSPEGRVLMVLGRKGIGAEADWLFNRPADVAFTANGDILIADGYGNSRIMRFDHNGHFIKSWGSFGDKPGQFDLPHSVVVDNQGRIYVADRENARIQIFDNGGNFITEWKGLGYPYGLFLTPNQHLWMADGAYDRVLELDLTGKILGTVGAPGHALGELAWPHFLSVAPNGNLYIADVLNWRVDVFVPTGKPSVGLSPYVPTVRMFDIQKPSVGWLNQPKK